MEFGRARVQVFLVYFFGVLHLMTFEIVWREISRELNDTECLEPFFLAENI